jgi:hypothetical protein
VIAGLVRPVAGAWDDARATPGTLRILALLLVVLFLPSRVSFFTVKSGTVWPEYPGVLFHLALLPLVAHLRAPSWVRSAGYGWITIDVLAGILAINGLAFDTYWPIRMGGHVLAGVWLIGASLGCQRLATRIVGVLTGLDLGGYSFVGNVAPRTFVYPAGILLVVWLTLLAVNARPEAAEPARGGHP